MIANSPRKALLAAASCALLAAAGCKAKPPGKWETAFVTGVERHITVGDKDVKNPYPATDENITSGKESFSHFCAACHGLDGQNTGVPFANRMSPPVPSLVSPEVQEFTDGQLKWVIDNGLSPSGMPGSKGILTDEEIWDAVIYIRHLPKAGGAGEPAMYSGEDCNSDDEAGTAKDDASKGKSHKR